MEEEEEAAVAFSLRGRRSSLVATALQMKGDSSECVLLSKSRIVPSYTNWSAADKLEAGDVWKREQEANKETNKIVL